MKPEDIREYYNKLTSEYSELYKNSKNMSASINITRAILKIVENIIEKETTNLYKMPIAFLNKYKKLDPEDKVTDLGDFIVDYTSNYKMDENGLTIVLKYYVGSFPNILHKDNLEVIKRNLSKYGIALETNTETVYIYYEYKKQKVKETDIDRKFKTYLEERKKLKDVYEQHQTLANDEVKNFSNDIYNILLDILKYEYENLVFHPDRNEDMYYRLGLETNPTNAKISHWAHFKLSDTLLDFLYKNDCNSRYLIDKDTLRLTIDIEGDFDVPFAEIYLKRLNLMLNPKNIIITAQKIHSNKTVIIISYLHKDNKNELDETFANIKRSYTESMKNNKQDIANEKARDEFAKGVVNLIQKMIIKIKDSYESGKTFTGLIDEERFPNLGDYLYDKSGHFPWSTCEYDKNDDKIRITLKYSRESTSKYNFILNENFRRLMEKIGIEAEFRVQRYGGEVIGGALELSYIYPILEKEKSQILSLGLKQKEGESTD